MLGIFPLRYLARSQVVVAPLPRLAHQLSQAGQQVRFGGREAARRAGDDGPHAQASTSGGYQRHAS